MPGLIVVSLWMTACGGEEPAASSPTGDWLLVAGVPTVDGYPITLSIGAGDVTGRAACNSFFGTVSTGGGSQIRFGQLGQTEMGCEPAVMASESAFLAALAAAERYELGADRLTLLGTMGDLEFELAPPVPTADLVGTRWVLNTLIEGGTVSSVGGQPATLLLEPRGNLVATTGCRSLTGTWRQSGGAIVVPELTAHGECSEDLWRQDSLVVTVIGDEFRAVIEGDRLTLTSMGGDGLGYRAEG